MPLINHSYFTGNIKVANKDKPEFLDVLNQFIVKYEKEFLVNALGYDLYTEFMNGLTATTPLQKWVDLRDGKVYLASNGVNLEFKGLANSTSKDSVIANYIYYHYMMNEVTQTTGIAEVQAKAENSIIESIGGKMEFAYNKMVDDVIVLVDFLTQNRTIYNNFNLIHFDYSLAIKINRFNI